MKAFSFLWKIWFAIYMLISTLAFYPFLIVSIILLKNYHLTFKIYRLWAWSICIAMGLFPSIIDKELIPKKGPFIIVANHTSQLDIVIPYTLIGKHFAFLAKEELAKVPLFDINFKGMNVTVNRKSQRSGGISLEACSAKLKNKINLLIFPEGTRSKTPPKMRAFKGGAFKLAIDNNVPIVPIAFLDNHRRLEGGKGPWKSKGGPGKCRVQVLPPLNTTSAPYSSVDQLMADAFKEVESAVLSAQKN